MTDKLRRAWLRVSAKHTGRLLSTRNHPDLIDIPITTARLAIRRFEPADLAPYLQFMTDAESTRFLALEPDQETEPGARALFDYVVRSYDAANPVNAYAIAERGTNDYVGSCGFAPYEAGVVECFYCINEEYRGLGFAVEAVGALLRALGTRIEVRAFCHSKNAVAHAVATGSGMKHVGRARNKNSGLEGELFVYGGR